MTDEIRKDGTTVSPIRWQGPIRSTDQLRIMLEQDPQLVAEMKKDPEETIAKIAGAPQAQRGGSHQMFW